MADFTDFLAEELIDHCFRATAYSAPATVYVGLHTTADPGKSGSDANEVSGGAYARTAVTFDAPAGSPRASDNQLVTFPTATASWGTVAWVALHDAATVGNQMANDAVTTSKLVDTDDTAEFAAGDLTITLD
jgi:hypothetical protein